MKGWSAIQDVNYNISSRSGLGVALGISTNPSNAKEDYLSPFVCVTELQE